MKIIDSSNRRAVSRLVDRQQGSDPTVATRVARIVGAIRRRGDRALLEYAKRFDGVDGTIEIPRRDIEAGARDAAPAVRRAIKTAARHIRRIASRQVPPGWKCQVTPGVVVEQRVTPLDAVGCYVPGGRYPLPSSLLMTAIPARVAGVREIVAACPRPEPSVLAAALEVGVTRLFQVGGAHSIAALAYGTETIPKVDKIVGPGNAYVAAAKTLVSAECPIDFTAGPSEIVTVARRGNPDWIAADLVAQAEHDPDARAILITPSAQLARKGRSRSRAETRGARRGPGIHCAKRCRRRHRQPRPGHHPGQSDRTGARGLRLRGGGATPAPRRHGVRGALQRPSGGRLRDGLQPCAPDERRRAVSRWPQRYRLRANPQRPTADRGGPEATRTNCHLACQCRRAQRARRVGCDAGGVTHCETSDNHTTDDGDADRPAAGTRWTWAIRRAHRHPLSRSHAGAGGPARALRSQARR